MWTRVVVHQIQESLAEHFHNDFKEYVINETHSLYVASYFDDDYSVWSYYLFVKDNKSGKINFMCDPHGEYVNGLYYGLDGDEFLFAWANRIDHTIVRINLETKEVNKTTRVDKSVDFLEVFELMNTTKMHLKEWFTDIIGHNNIKELDKSL